MNAHPPQLARLLEEEPDLALDLDAASASAARRLLVAPVERLRAGPWQPPRPYSQIMILDGFLLRSVLMSGIGCTELLGRGDLLDPSLTVEGEASIPLRVEWRVLEPSRVALLDERFTTAAARWPPVGARLTARAQRRADNLAELLAITCLPRLDLRVYVLFWHLADRFGRVNAKGVVVPVRLTHETLARLVAARRPSVTTALGRLRSDGLLACSGEGWLVSGDPPSESTRTAWRSRDVATSAG